VEQEPLTQKFIPDITKGDKMPYSKYSAKQRRLAAVAPPRTKITGADLAKVRKKKKKKK
jgi:hypothetical protein